MSNGVSGGPEEAEDAADVGREVDKDVEGVEEASGDVLESTTGKEVEDAAEWSDEGVGASCCLLEGRCREGHS